MSEQSASNLREQAARCRRLAAVTYDQSTHDSLRRSAEEYEEQASRRAAEGSGNPV